MTPAELLIHVLTATSLYADMDRLVVDGQIIDLGKGADPPQTTARPASIVGAPTKEWIPLGKRRPPNDDTYVYAWNVRLGRPIVTSGAILNAQFDQMFDHSFRKKMEASTELIFTGYFCTHWKLADGGPIE